MGTLSHISDERTCNGRSTYVDSTILDVTKNRKRSMNKLVQECLYLVLLQGTATISLFGSATGPEGISNLQNK